MLQFLIKSNFEKRKTHKVLNFLHSRITTTQANDLGMNYSKQNLMDKEQNLMDKKIEWTINVEVSQ